MFTTIFKTLYAHSTELSFTDLRCNYDDIYEVYTDSSEITMVSVTVSNHDVLIKFSNELTYDVNVAIFVNALDGQFIPVTSYNQLTDLPILFDGDYENLTNKPDIPQEAEDLPCVNPSTLEDDTTQNVLDELYSNKQDTLIAGENITIEDNVISASGGSVSSTQCEVVTELNTPIADSAAGVLHTLSLTKKYTNPYVFCANRLPKSNWNAGAVITIISGSISYDSESDTLSFYMHTSAAQNYDVEWLVIEMG